MKKSIGSIICTLGSPSPSEFSFVVTATDNKIPVRQGQFVEVENEEGKMIAFVTNVIKTNRYYMRAEAVKEYEGNSPISTIFPADRWEYLIAQARVLGIQNGLEVERASFPPSPGQKVYEIDHQMLANFLGFDSNNGLEIGELKHHNLPVKLDMTRLIQKHVAVLAMSGAGKSVSVLQIIEELLNRLPSKGRPAVVVVDVHGEYKSLTDSCEDGAVVVIKAEKVRVGVPNLSSRNFKEFVPEMSEVQARELQRVLDEMREEMRAGKGTFGLDELIARIEQVGGIHKQIQQALLGWLFDLRAFNVFDHDDDPNWKNAVAPGKVVILDLSDVVSIRKKQMLVAHLARRLFNFRKRWLVPPFVLCVEEAHQFVPTEPAISKHVIETIAREGRKFYASLILVSQRPVKLSTTVLSQASTNILLRITNPYDLEHIKQSSEAITSEVANMISALPVGEALIVGEAVNYPIFVRIRRKSLQYKVGASLEDVAREFEAHGFRTREDAKAFM